MVEIESIYFLFSASELIRNMRNVCEWICECNKKLENFKLSVEKLRRYSNRLVYQILLICLNSIINI